MTRPSNLRNGPRTCCLDGRDGRPCDCWPTPPMQLTARGQRLATALLLALVLAVLVTAGLLGQQLRCERLHDSNDPAAATYCRTTPAEPEEPRP